MSTTWAPPEPTIRSRIGRRRTHGIPTASPFPRAQDVPLRAAAAERRRRRRELGARRGALVVECEEPPAHGRHAWPRLLAERGTAPEPVAGRARPSGSPAGAEPDW